MFVSVDGEGRQEGDVMSLMTLSIGREDGSSATHIVGDGGVRGALLWLVDQLAADYTDADGNVFKQVPVAFHFNWDTAVMAKDFNPFRDHMFLVRKVQKPIMTTLCGSEHPTGACPMEGDLAVRRAEMAQEAMIIGAAVNYDEGCDLLHRYDPTDINSIITNGGEGDLAAYDSKSSLAIATTPGRRFYVEHRPHGDRFEEWRRVDIHDTGSAFVGGLLKVISDWNPELTDEQREIIEWGKQRRTETFEVGEIDDIIRYSEAECVAHARVCRKLLDLIKDAAHVNIAEDRLFGSGSIAGAALKHYHAPPRNAKFRKGEVADAGSDLFYEEIAQMTYFGGMIETPVVGLVEGLTDEVDINSAYPHKMIYIPCTRKWCGQWRVTDGDLPPDAIVGHVQVVWYIEEGTTSTPPFMVRRRDGRVAMPRMMDTPTWVTLAEYRAAVERFPSSIEISRAIYWEPNCRCGNPRPFEFLQTLYDRRLEIKNRMKVVEKDSPEWWNLSCREKAIKLVINSIYGKLAQQDPQPGAYTNLHLASYITGATRAQVRRETWARENQGGTVVYQHTDSVLSVGGNPADGGKQLGAWGMEKPSKNLLIVQPGLATALGGGKSASRGCKLGAFKEAVEEWLAAVDLTKPPIEWPKLTTRQKVMISRRQAMAWGKPHLAGSFQTKVTEISPISPKREIDNARPMGGNPTAWEVPPVDYVDDPATLKDVMRMRRHFVERRRSGEYDQ